ncbi:MAG: helix-turn-helix domain-containing protein [Thermincolia bacterium]
MKIKGEKVRLLREERGYTLQEFAQKAGVSVSYLSELERGAKQPSLKTLDKLAITLNLPREQLVDTAATDKLGIGDKLRLAREQKGLTLAQLAQELNLSAAYLSEIETGKVVPAVSTIRGLANQLEIPVPTLVGPTTSLGLKLRTMRDQQGFTQAALANKAGVSPGLIAQVEQGKIQPSFKTVEKLSGVLGVSPCYFVLDNESVEEMLPAMNPELLKLLNHPNAQAVMRLICHMNEKELQFILNFIQLFKRSEVTDFE